MRSVLLAAAISSAIAAMGVLPIDQKPTSIDIAVQQISAEKDPGTIVETYSAGLSIDRDSIPLREAYIRKMIQIDLPGQAASAASRLLELQPSNALARIVVADDEARHGEFREALTDLAIAGPKVPDEPFAQQTAARLFAWYDNAESKPGLPESINQSLAQIRHDWQDLRIYRTAYQESSDAYKQQSAREGSRANASTTETAPAPPTTTEEASTSAPDNYVEPPITYYGTGYTEPMYSPTVYAPLASYSYPDYDYYAPYAYPYNNYYGAYPGYYVGFSFFNSHFHHDHGDGHGNGHWDGHHDWSGSHGTHFSNPSADIRSRSFVGPRASSSQRGGGTVTAGPSRPTVSSPRPSSPRPSSPSRPSGGGSRGGGHHR